MLKPTMFRLSSAFITAALVRAQDGGQAPDPLQECQTALQAAQAQTQDITNQANGQLQQLQAVVQDRDNSIHLLQQKLDESNGALAPLKKEVQELTEKLASNDGAQAPLEKEVQDLKAKLESAEIAQGEANDAAHKASKDLELTNAELKKIREEHESSTEAIEKAKTEAKEEVESAKKAASSKLTKELTKAAEKAKSDAKSEKKKADAKISELEKALAELKQKASSSQNYFMEFAEKSNKLLALLHDKILEIPFISDKLNNSEESIFTLSQLQLQTDFHRVSRLAYGHASELTQVSSALFSEGRVRALELYADVYGQLEPTVLNPVKEQASALYSQHLEEHVGPVYVEMRKTLKDLQVEETVYEGLGKLYDGVDAGNKAMAEASSVASTTFLPLVTDAVSVLRSTFPSSSDVSAVAAAFVRDTGVNLLFQRITLELLGQDFEFENGVLDVTVHFVFLGIALYVAMHATFVLTKMISFCLRFFLGLIMYQVFYKLLLKTVLYGVVVRGFFFTLTFVLSLALFAVKLALCCGCCGLCFRRRSASNAKLGSNSASATKTTKGKSAAGGQGTKPDGKATKPQVINKKKK